MGAVLLLKLFCVRGSIISLLVGSHLLFGIFTVIFMVMYVIHLW
jgi:hypothetical protein